MTPRRTAIVTALGLALLAGGCGSEPSWEPAATSTPTPAAKPQRAGRVATGAANDRLRGAEMAVDQAAIGALVRARANALGGGRPTAYSATAAGARRGPDAAEARRARRLGVRGVRIEGLGIRVRGRRATASARLSYRLAGVAGRWTYGQVLRLRRTGGGWYVVGLRQRAPRPPWELAAYERSASRHFTVFSPEDVDPASADLAATLERAYATIGERLPGRLRRRYAVLIAGDPGDMAAMTRGIRDVGRLSAITDLSLRTAGPAQRVTAVVGVRILIPWPSFLALSPSGRERVLTHELAHAALAPVTSGRAPAWLQEGIALYVSGDKRTDTARPDALLAPGSRLGRLASPNAMAPLAGEDLSAAYALSSSTAYYVAERYRPRALLDLLAAFGDESLPGRPGRSLADRAVRRVLGIGVRRLERDVGEWLRGGALALGG